MHKVFFYIGLDDTDAPDGMCTTWLGTVLARLLQQYGMEIIEARLVRLNPTIPYKTRGNASISLYVRGEPGLAFSMVCDLIIRYAVLSCEKTNPGVVISLQKPPSDFYWKAVRGICTIEEAKKVISEYALYSRGYKLGRGLIGATAAICSEFPDFTWEFLAYRKPNRFLLLREVNPDSFALSEEETWPHTWDTWDFDAKNPVCIPHSPDPVLFGIRGDSPFSVSHAVSFLITEPSDLVQIWKTNQGTDAHLVKSNGENLDEGISYAIKGNVFRTPVTGKGGHVSFQLQTDGGLVSCMAFEPTKKFRDYIRSLRSGDTVLVAGSYLRETLNVEKFYVFSADPYPINRAPQCPACQKRMTSAGSGKGYKCRHCGHREKKPETEYQSRTITPGWYEVPPGSRRHLARPLARGLVDPDCSYLPFSRKESFDRSF